MRINPARGVAVCIMLMRHERRGAREELRIVVNMKTNPESVIDPTGVTAAAEVDTTLNEGGEALVISRAERSGRTGSEVLTNAELSAVAERMWRASGDRGQKMMR